MDALEVAVRRGFRRLAHNGGSFAPVNRRRLGGLQKKFTPMRFFCMRRGTGPPLLRCAVRIVTFCPPALAIHDMSPDAPTSPPPVAPPGSNLSGAPPLHPPSFRPVIPAKA